MRLPPERLEQLLQPIERAARKADHLPAVLDQLQVGEPQRADYHHRPVIVAAVRRGAVGQAGIGRLHDDDGIVGNACFEHVTRARAVCPAGRRRPPARCRLGRCGDSARSAARRSAPGGGRRGRPQGGKQRDGGGRCRCHRLRCIEHWLPRPRVPHAAISAGPANESTPRHLTGGAKSKGPRTGPFVGSVCDGLRPSSTFRTRPGAGCART